MHTQLKRFFVFVVSFLAWLALCCYAIPSHAGEAVIFNGPYVKALKQSINLFDQAYVLTGTADPTAVATTAPRGSLYLRTGGAGGTLYIKQDNGLTTNWIDILSSNSGWALVGNAGTNSAINFVGTTDAQDFVVRANNTVQLTFSQTGGWLSDQDFDPTDGVNKTQYSLQTDLDPTASTTTANNSGLYNLLNYDGGDTGFDYSGNLSAMGNRFTHVGSGTLNTVFGIDNSALFGNVAGTTGLFKGTNLDVQVNSGYTITSYNGVNSYLNSTTGVLGGANLFDSNAALADSTINNGLILNGNFNLTGTSTATGTIQGLSTNVRTQDTATANALIGSRVGANAAGDSVVGGIEGVTSNVLVQDNAVITNQAYGSNFGVTLEDNAVTNGTTGIISNTLLQDAANGGNTIGANIGVTISGTAVASSVNAITTNPDIAGSGAVGNVNVIAAGGNIHGTNAITNYIGGQFTPTLQGSATATDMTGMNISPSVQGTATLTNPLTGLNVNPNSSVALSGVKGISIDVSGATVADPFQKVAITANGGSFGANYGFTIPGATTFFQTHYLGGQEIVASGDPTNAYGFGNNLAHTIQFDDNWGPDVTTLRLGFVDVGFVGSIVGSTGNTMDSWTGALAGFNNPSGAGTIDQAIMFRAAGGLPQGGTLAVTNMYGLLGMTTLCGIATDCWGVNIADPAANNWFSNNLVVGGTSELPTNASVGIEIQDVTKAFLPSRMDTTERDALTATEGMIIHNTDINAPQYYDGTVWQGFGGSSTASTSELFTLTGGITDHTDVDGIRLIEAVSTLTQITACLYETGTGGNTTVRVNYGPALASNTTISIPGTGGPGCATATPGIALSINDLINIDVTAVADGAPEDLSVKLFY